jgi:predicted RNase H-like nuclease
MCSFQEQLGKLHGGGTVSARFIGLDLAWSPRNNSAVVVLEAEARQACWIDHREQLKADHEVISFLRDSAHEGPALVAIDAPLIVPNEQGARPVDRAITRIFGRFGAGCYPANRSRGCTRGEVIVEALCGESFVHDPHIQQRTAKRAVFEVYPHPATIALFDLERTLKYKARAGRTLGFRRQQLASLRDHLLGLANAEPAMLSSPDLATNDLQALRGLGLKQHEDLLDAAVCAYTAYYAWYWGAQGYRVYGDTCSGYILVPMTQNMRQRLAAHGIS